MARNRSVYSIRRSLLAKSREAALTAVQTYNNPLIRFKSETYVVLMTIAWTFLLHAYYRSEKVDYRHLNTDPSQRGKYARMPGGGYKWWELSTCLKAATCPLDAGTVNNLTFLIGLRNEIEHHMPPDLDNYLSGRYVACALNYEYWLTRLFGERHSLGDMVALAIHFRDLTSPTATNTKMVLPTRLANWIQKFDDSLSQEGFNDPRFAFRMVFVPKIVNKKGQADRAIEFIRADSPEAQGLVPERVLIRESEKPKFRPKDIVRVVSEAGYSWFGVHQHTDLGQTRNAKDPAFGFGIEISGQWYWYQRWVDEVLDYCMKRAATYGLVVVPTTVPPVR